MKQALWPTLYTGLLTLNLRVKQQLLGVLALLKDLRGGSEKTGKVWCGRQEPWLRGGAVAVKSRNRCSE